MLTPFVACALGSGFVCVALAWRQRARVSRLAPPPVAELLREILADDEEALQPCAKRLAVAELNQRLGDVAFQLSLLPAMRRALLRIALASGFTFAFLGGLLGARFPPLENTLRAGVTVLGGLVGASLVALIGRGANSRATQVREQWDATSREAGKALGASLQAPVGPGADEGVRRGRRA